MAHALIKINGTDAQFVAVAIGSTVNLSNHDEGGEVSYAWQIVDQPEGTADALSATGVENVSFVPTKEGSYLLKLTVNAALVTVSVQTAIVAVLEARTGDRIPAAAEVLETGSTGWAPAVKRILSRALHATVDSNLIIAQTPGGIAAGGLVTLTGSATINAGSQSAFGVPQLAAALATGVHRERIGILIDGVATGVLSANVLVFVRMFGLVPFSSSGSPAVGDPVYLSNTGLPALTPGTITRVIGFVVSSSAGSYQWAIDAGPLPPGTYFGTQTLSGSGTYTPTPGTRFVRVRMIGGGGGGGGASSTGAGTIAAGAGGTTGVLLQFQVGTPGGAILTGGAFSCGAIGAAGAAAAGNGGNGGDTTVVIGGTTFTSKGGGGGGGMAATSGAAGVIANSMPTAPAAGTSAVGKSTWWTGGTGVAIGGGSPAWYSGFGGASPFGPGGLQVGGGTAGNAGTGAGSGGSGGAATANTNRAGGAGAVGSIEIDEHS